VFMDGGFSLHTVVSTADQQRQKLERLCRYVSRPAMSEKRLVLTASGSIRYQPGRPRTKPRVNLTSFHGVFARGGLLLNSKFRVYVTPAKRGKGRKRRQQTGDSWQHKAPVERHQSMTWMQRLKRVFNIDIETCERCAGQVKIIACIEERVSHHRAYR
jgi:hypothetical protein